MIYHIRWDAEALEDLRELDRTDAKRIVKKVESHLVKDPLSLGKPLSGNLGGLYRYRIGDYRVIYQVIRAEIVIDVVRIGHRREVYEE